MHAEPLKVQHSSHLQKPVPLQNSFALLGCMTEDREPLEDCADLPNQTVDTVGVRQVHPQKVQPSKIVLPASGGKLKAPGENVRTFALFEPDSQLHYVPQGPKWTKIESVMDSGAAESVAPLNVAPWVPAAESEGSRRGKTYMSAGSEKLPNLEKKKLDVVTTEGKAATATFQCADVTRSLCAVSKISDRGNRVIFEADGGYIESRSGSRTAFKRENNVYILDMYVRKPEGATRPSGFAQQST